MTVQKAIPEVPMSATLNHMGNDHFQLGEPYVIHYTMMRAHASGETELEQITVLSPFLAGEGNAPPFVIGAVKAHGVEARFVHPETILELVRLGHEMFRAWLNTISIEQQLLDGLGPATVVKITIDAEGDVPAQVKALLDQVEAKLAHNEGNPDASTTVH